MLKIFGAAATALCVLTVSTAATQASGRDNAGTVPGAEFAAAGNDSIPFELFRGNRIFSKAV